MDSLRIIGGGPLTGHITISGAKNAALAIMPAAVLTDKPLTLTNIPNVADIKGMRELMAQMGINITGAAPSLTFDANNITNTTAPYELVRKMRASIFLLAPLVARMQQAKVSLPGGCAIGTRPVDLYISGLTQMGAQIELDGGYINARAPQGGLKGARITFPFVSVGATESMMMAATLAHGTTELVNAAREPEVSDLANCLTAMGAKISGIGSDKLVIEGTGGQPLSGGSYRIISDRIEAGTYAMAAGITGGTLLLEGAELHHLAAAQTVLEKAGLSLTQTPKGILAERTGDLVGVDAMTEPYPGFATDLQAQYMALMTVASGAAMITETIFENRFMHVPELGRMGANITVHGSSALVRGVPKLKGAPVMATDLRASVSLVLAALVADGETTISRIYHLDRGYSDLETKLSACGAQIERIKSTASIMAEEEAA
jgi:UDP-N-acetylglucosamine 1-carboxyvinyltransferase